MASIVQRNKSFSVVYTIYDGDKKKQKWETYHSYEAALRRKEQLDLIQQHEKERAQYREGTLVQFLEEYVELYGRIHWACSTYTSNEGLIRNYIVLFMGSMRLTEFSPKIIAVLYGKLQSDPRITPSVLTNIHKLLHSAFEQAVLWEYVPRNPFQKANVPKAFPTEIPMLTTDEIKILIRNCDNPMLSIAIHLAFSGSLRKGKILALTWDDVDFQKGTISVSKTLKRVRRDAANVLNGKDILYQFPAVFDEGRTVTLCADGKEFSPYGWTDAHCHLRIEVIRHAGGSGKQDGQPGHQHHQADRAGDDGGIPAICAVPAQPKGEKEANVLGKPCGEQTIDQLVAQNQGATNIEIDKTDLKGFKRILEKYGVDYAITKSTTQVLPRYLVFFKARDGDVLIAAFQEYSAALTQRQKKPSVLKQLQKFKALVATNLGEAWRLTEGDAAGEKIMSLIYAIPQAFGRA